MSKRDVFWRLFQASGHIGAYLLYAWSEPAESRREAGAGLRRALGAGRERGGVNASVNGRESAPPAG